MKYGTFLLSLTALTILAAFAAPVWAGPREDAKANAARCDRIADDRSWLDCYYGAAQPVRAELGLPPAPTAQLALVPAPLPGRPAESAGAGPGSNFFQRLLTHRDVVAEAPTHIAAYTFDKSGFFTVTLANGEIWKQNGVDSTQAKWRNRPESYEVKILPGSRMEVNGHETYQVIRLR